MNFMIDIDLKKLPRAINYQDRILLVGSCFTEHIGNSLEELKFPVLQNPNGILFDPASVCRSLDSYIEDKRYGEEDFFQLNDVWHSWQHHSRFSNTKLSDAVLNVNQSQERAHAFLEQANWLIITLGSSFSYRLTDQASGATAIGGMAIEGAAVSNCHRAPAQWFTKYLMTTNEIISGIENSLEKLSSFNPQLEVIFTISPVRHIRDGIVDNNRSKAHLIEAVHHVVGKHRHVHYFPAYELVIDVLRDYRFYDIDLVHPNYAATEFVLEKFATCCIADHAAELMEEVRKIVIAKKHRPLQPGSEAHQRFLQTQWERALSLQQKFPYLNLNDEINYFSGKQTL